MTRETRMAQTERHALCEAALAVGEDQPTLCGDWTVKDLVVHLLVRERSPAALGIVVKPLTPLLDLESRRVGSRSFTELVEKVRQGPPLWSPYAVPKLDVALNTLEYYVHHEDIRRAQPGWEPRPMTAAAEKQLWAMTRTAGKPLVRKAEGGVVMENLTTGSTAVLKEGEPSVTVRGLPSEITLFVFGRQEHARVELIGDAADVDALRTAPFGA